MGRKKNRFYKDLPKVKETIDTNITVIDGDTVKTVTASDRITAAPTAPVTSQVSGRKAKQLEKYLVKKLKKDSRPALFAQLQEHAMTADMAAKMQSTKDLLVPSKRAMSVIDKVEKAEEVFAVQEQDADSDSDLDSDDEQVIVKRKPTTDHHHHLLVMNESVDMHAAIKSIKHSSLNPLYTEEESLAVESDDEDTNKELELEEPMAMMPPHRTYFVTVARKADLEEQRIKLPISAEEQQIMEAIIKHPVTVICGETGSGKTTQVPQFLYEAGFGDTCSPNPGLIGITQPRRIAAISMCRRVGEELNKPDHVAYQVRYDGTVSKDTRMKFMTDGILLRELTDDFLLQKYSVILLDEAHERNLNTDILIGMLSRVVRLRRELSLKDPLVNRPLRLVVMSATLNIEEFVHPRLFHPTPPIIRVEARQHPVTPHFAKRTNVDYVEEAYKTITKIHSNLPSGGILVFLTGKQEIVKLARMLTKKYSSAPYRSWREDEVVDNEDEDEFIMDQSDSDHSDGENSESEFAMKAETREPLHVLPLYSLLAPEEQLKVFQSPPEGHRLCVLATNVAETSLTIPNIRYVVDSGLVKQRHFDPSTGAQEYRVEWTSKASATQRAGRAGRVGPGHVYRLYSSAVFDQQFPDFSIPEIQRTPIEGLVLQLKTMGIDKASRFPLPSQPGEEAVMQAERNLVRMGALCPVKTGGDLVKITALGRMMAKLPLAPLWSRLVVMACEMGESPHLAIALASVTSVGDPFLDASPHPSNNSSHSRKDDDDDGNDGEEERGLSKEQKEKINSMKQIQLDLAGKPPSSDVLMWLNAFITYTMQAGKDRISYCDRMRLMAKRMEEMSQQYHLLIRLIKPLYRLIDWQNAGLSVPKKNHTDSLCKLLAESLSDKVAERVPNPIIQSQSGTFKKLPFPCYRLTNRSSDDPTSLVYLHPTSILYRHPPKTLCYTELTIRNDRPFIKYVTAIQLTWLDS